MTRSSQSFELRFPKIPKNSQANVIVRIRIALYVVLIRRRQIGWQSRSIPRWIWGAIWNARDNDVRRVGPF